MTYKHGLSGSSDRGDLRDGEPLGRGWRVLSVASRDSFVECFGFGMWYEHTVVCARPTWSPGDRGSSRHGNAGNREKQTLRRTRRVDRVVSAGVQVAAALRPRHYDGTCFPGLAVR